MPDPADKKPGDAGGSPAPAAAASAVTEQTPAAGQAAAPAAEPNALQTELQRERERRIESERQYANLHSLYGKQTRELGTLRGLRDSVFGAGQGEDTPGVDSGLEEVAGEVQATREEVAWMRFQQAHPQYREFWDEMKEIAGDPVYKRTIESYRVVRGQPALDTFATLHNAYNEVELRRMRKAQGEAAVKRADAAANSKKIVSQATISGSGAASDEGGSGLTLEQILAMDYNELIKHPEFQAHVDPNDPPRGI